ncbi:hypothetical protein ACJIZ3_014847 [Penstemon smallii]|uniref:Protein Lines C-terminal domain-containing protein n=1 Tax=Penstemon smallii TaxID=265156 RepID=A0ABD3RKS4_9LAMI
MSPRPEYLRLCLLLDDALRPFSDLSAISVTEELEKDTLIALSEVLRQVKQWTQEFDSDEEELTESVDKRECSTEAASYLDNRHCLAKFISDLIPLLAVNSRYTQHLVGNTLVAISEFVIASETSWDDFMQLLCLCLELAICNTLSSSSEHDALKTRYSDYYSLVSKAFLKQELTWSALAAIVRVLRSILKHLKQDIDENITEVFLDSVSSSILNIPWNLLFKLHVDRNIEVLKVSDISLHMIVFVGNFIQFICSMLNQEVGAGSSQVICKINTFVPILVAWCHAELQSPQHARISNYLRHKVLMLIIKLSSHIKPEDKIVLSWLHLLHQYFEDLLLQPISGVKNDQDCSLEGSPFCTSFLDPVKQNISSRHLQRLAVFLFLSCSLNLVSAKQCCHEKCTCANLKSLYTSDPKFDSECCNKSKGLIELHKWLQAHVPHDIITSHELYFHQCVRFTSSFLQLFMHEDDILFKILLQLLSVSNSLKRQIIESEPLSEVKNDLVFPPLDLFNPINIFHLFLAEVIIYDHQVLLDYLISNDIGSSCAEYLLRSLRIVCDSWNLFVEFPGVDEGLGESCSKRQKVIVDDFDFNGMSSPAQLKHGGNYRLSFVAARDCLVSLRASIDSLNQKNLFPYNPQVLLRRLMRFEELCIKE